MTQTLSTLLKALPGDVLPVYQGDPDQVVTGLTVDSRRVAPGFLFIALQGTRDDGHRFVPDALARGASAVLVSRDVPVAEGVTRAIVPDTRAVLPELASRFFGAPSAHMTLVGITGTNGKTTVSYLLEHVLENAGRPTGVVGTVNYRYPGACRTASNTTPDLITFQSLLAEMGGAGVQVVVAEVSSHALVQGRVEGLQFDAALFTNLSRDHLDYHGTLEAYFQAKRRLFDEILGGSPKPDTLAVINVDDAHGGRLAATARAGRVWRFSVRPGADAEVYVKEADLDIRGIRAHVVTPVGDLVIASSSMGLHSLQNLVAAAGLAAGLGVPLETISSALASAPPAPGRLEVVPNRLGMTVLVDYAHTPSALAAVLGGLQPLAQGALIVVFGCGGDRDPGKRPLMGEAAASRATLSIVTTDNPRHEDPHAIIAEVVSGVARVAVPWQPDRPPAPGGHAYIVIPDRVAAITLALETAREGDVVIIAGKGHETSQVIAGRRIPFDDRRVARRVLARLEGRS